MKFDRQDNLTKGRVKNKNYKKRRVCTMYVLDKIQIATNIKFTPQKQQYGFVLCEDRGDEPCL